MISSIFVSISSSINELLANDVLLVSKILLVSEEALWPNKSEKTHASLILSNDRQILVLSYLITTVKRMTEMWSFQAKNNKFGYELIDQNLEASVFIIVLILTMS